MTEHCCQAMRDELSATCAEHDDRFACPDALFHYDPRFDEYGLIVHDGGSSVRGIAFCPWCGATLPESKRDRWFEALYALGIESPSSDPVPREYQSDLWWRAPSASTDGDRR